MKGRIAAAVLGVVIVGAVSWRLVTVVLARAGSVERSPEVALVRTAAVERADLAERVAFTGSVRPRNEVDVFTKVPGRIELVGANVGDRVQAGHVLAVVEHKEIAWQAKTAEAGLRTALAALDGARLELERTDALAKAGAAPAALLDGARVRLSVAEAQVAQAEAGAGLARQQVANATTLAPISGTVTRRLANFGAQVAPGFPLFTIQDVATLKLEAAVDATVFARLAIGMPAAVSVEEIAANPFPARVSVLSPTLDPTTRRASLELEIDNSSGKLMPNMYARAEVVVGQLRQALAVPQAAVFAGAGGRQLFRVRGDRVEVVRAKLGFGDGDKVAVLEGLAEGDVVATSGLAGLADGSRVAIASDGDHAPLAAAPPTAPAPPTTLAPAPPIARDPPGTSSATTD